MGIYLEFGSRFPLLGFGATHIAPPSLSPGKTATTLPIRSLSLSKYWGYSTSGCIFCQGTENREPEDGNLFGIRI